jgi:hypothetical protein
VASIRTAAVVGVILGAVLLASCSNTQTAGQAAHVRLSVADTGLGSCGHPPAAEDLTAETQSGEVVQIDSGTLMTRIIAQGVLPFEGVTQRAGTDQLYVTARSSGGLPSVWEIPTSACRPHARLVEARAELSSVSPDGRYLGYVTIDGRGRQTGVSIVRLAGNGDPTGPAQQLDAAKVPPTLPIQGIAVGVDDRMLAVWGGFVDPYLGRNHPTVGTLVPAAARSLSSLSAVFDEEGISLPSGSAQSMKSPEAWQAAPSYMANGDFLVWTLGGEIAMPFTDTTPGVGGGGIRNIQRVSGAVTSLAAGPSGSLAWVGPHGHLEIARGAIDLPFGPQATAVPTTSLPVVKRVKGTYSSVTWSTGTSPQATMPAPVYNIVDHLPSLVGLTAWKAQMVMAKLALPTFVGHTVDDHNVPPDTVLAQDPSAGTTIACQCAIALTVSATR